MVLRCGRQATVPLVVYDQFANPISCEYVYSTGLTGVIDPYLNITDTDGLAPFVYSFDEICCGLTGYDVDKLAFIVRNPYIEQHLYVDLVGCDPTGVS